MTEEKILKEAAVASQCITYTLGHEGKLLTEIPDDLGGRTKYGITQILIEEIGDKYDVSDVSQLDEQRAMIVYMGEFFTPAKCMEIYNIVDFTEKEKAASQVSAEDAALLFAKFHFDTAVNHGIGNAVKILQRALNIMNRKGDIYADIAVDGGIGANTLRALKLCLENRSTKDLFQTLCAVRTAYYIHITEKRDRNETFIAGWLNRVGDFYKKKGELWA